MRKTNNKISRAYKEKTIPPIELLNYYIYIIYYIVFYRVKSNFKAMNYYMNYYYNY